MRTIQLELQDTLAEKLTLYHDNITELLELGLQAWLEREWRDQQAHQARLLQVLAASGKVSIPQPYPGEQPYARHTPVPITGKPLSEILMEQRGPR